MLFPALTAVKATITTGRKEYVCTLAQKLQEKKKKNFKWTFFYETIDQHSEESEYIPVECLIVSVL